MMEILLKTIPCSKNINEVAGYFLATSFVFFKKKIKMAKCSSNRTVYDVGNYNR